MVTTTGHKFTARTTATLYAFCLLLSLSYAGGG